MMGTESNEVPEAKAKKPKKPVDRTLYASQEAAEAKKPEDGKLRLYAVACPGGTTVYCWSGGVRGAVVSAAKADGYKAAPVGRAVVPATKDAVGAALAALSPEDRAALLAQHAPAPDKKGGKK